MANAIDAVFEAIIQPGASSSTVQLMNHAFYALFLTLTALAILTTANIHVIALLGISIALWASINWFVAELAKMPAEARQVQQMPSSTDIDAAGPSSASSSEAKKDK